MSVGKFSDQGFAVGLTRHAGQVEEASKDVGKTAVDSLKKSMSGLSAIVNDEMDADPVIRPVLDLSSVRKDAGQISGLVSGSKIGAELSYDQASSIRRARLTDSNSASDVDRQASSDKSFNFYQYNSSPKALSRVEIYRQTKNQLSMAKRGYGE